MQKRSTNTADASNAQRPQLPTHRVIRLVLPTDWSPNSTIFVRLSGDDEKSAEAGVPGVAIELECQR